MANTPYYTKAEAQALFQGEIKNFAGKTIVCFGDSVTENGNYPDQLSTITGATVFNVGIGGSRLSYTGNVNYRELSVVALSQAVSTGNYAAVDAAVTAITAQGDNNSAIIATLKSINFNNVDIVTIFAGTNDFDGDFVQLGSLTDTVNTTIRGAVNLIVHNLLTAYPHLKIHFITPTHRFHGTANEKDSDLVPNGVPLYLINYCDAIRETANYNHLPAFDMYRNGGFNKQNHSYYFIDNVHPNQLGQDLISNKIAAFLTSQIKY